MIAFVLRETGRDPAWLIGAPVPQLGSNAGFGDGYLVVEGDESDRTVFSLPAEIAVVTNIELDHHSEFASAAELRASSTAGLRARRDRRPRRAGLRGRAGAPGRATTASTPARRSLRSSSPAFRARTLRPRSRASRAPAAASRCTSSDRSTIVDDYAHHPTEIARTIAAARERFPGAAVRVLFQPHLVLPHAPSRVASWPQSLAGADDVTVTDIYAGARAADRRRHGQARRRRALRPRRARGAGRRRSRRGRRACAGERGPATCCSSSAQATSTGRVGLLGASVSRRGGRRLVAVHDDRHRRPGAVVRSARDGRGAGGGAPLGARRRLGGRDDRARLEPARARRGSRRARAQARRRSRRCPDRGRSARRGRRRGECRVSPSRARRRARRASSSPRRSRAPPAAGCG